MRVNLNFVVLFVMGAFLVGCSMLQPRSRELVLRKDWVRQTWEGNYMSYRLSHQSSPIAYQDMIIQGNAIDGVTAYNRKRGNLLWRMNVQNGVASGLQEANGRLYFGGSDGQFYCIDALTGKLNWSFPTRVENLSEPLVTEGVVYFLSGNDTLYALNADTGKQNWVYVRNNASELSIRGGSRPVLQQGSLYIGFADGYLVALHARDGTIAWERQLNTNIRFKDVDSTPVIDGNSIFVSGFDNALYSLTKQTGQIQWRLEGGSSYPATLDSDRLYYATSTGQVRAVNKQSGNMIWEVPVKKGIATRPVRFKEYLVFGETAGDLRVVQPNDGKDVISYTPRLGVNSAALPYVETNHIYFMSNHGNLYSMILQWERPEALTKLRVGDIQ